MDKTDSNEPISAVASNGVISSNSPRELFEYAAGPLFKELYAGLLDIEDPKALQPVLAKETRSLLAHTTDIQTLAQFHSLHQVPQKSGTAYHHKTYLNTVEQLKA